MSLSIECVACGASFKVPDAIYERRIRGRLATLVCKKCKAPIEVDGRGAGDAPTDAAEPHEPEPVSLVFTGPTSMRFDAEWSAAAEPEAAKPEPEAPKPEPEAPKPEAPKPEALKPEPEAPKPEAPKPEAPKPEAPKPEAPKPEPEPVTATPQPKPENKKLEPTKREAKGLLRDSAPALRTQPRPNLKPIASAVARAAAAPAKPSKLELRLKRKSVRPPAAPLPTASPVELPAPPPAAHAAPGASEANPDELIAESVPPSFDVPIDIGPSERPPPPEPAPPPEAAEPASTEHAEPPALQAKPVRRKSARRRAQPNRAPLKPAAPAPAELAPVHSSAESGSPHTFFFAFLVGAAAAAIALLVLRQTRPAPKELNAPVLHTSAVGSSPVDTTASSPTDADAAAGSGTGDAASLTAGSFDREAARKELELAAEVAAACRKAGSPAGTAYVSVIFGTTGRVQNVRVTNSPFEGTPTGTCVSDELAKVRVSPFRGSSVTITQTVRVR